MRSRCSDTADAISKAQMYSLVLENKSNLFYISVGWKLRYAVSNIWQ